MNQPRKTNNLNHNNTNNSDNNNSLNNKLVLNKFCSCLELWKGCILAGIFTMSTSVFDLLWSIAHMIDEDTVIFFYLLFSLGIESVIFIAATGLLFIALIKRSKCLLIPWLLMAFVDVFFSLMIAFAELAVPSNLNISGCTVPAVSMVVTLMVCFITIYCWLCVYGQYLHYAKNNVNLADIKVSPIDDLGRPNSSRARRPNETIGNQTQVQHLQPQQAQLANNIDLSNNNPNIDTLQVPHISTPRDAW